MTTPYTKDPEAIRIYSIDWSDYLEGLAEGAVITDSEWSVPDGLTAESESTANTFTTIKLSGGVVNTDYTIYNTVTTSTGEADRRTILIQVRDASLINEASQYDEPLAAVRALLANKATQDQKEYTIANRQLRRYDMAELLALETRLTQLVAAERRKNNARRGLPVLQNIRVRFTEPR